MKSYRHFVIILPCLLLFGCGSAPSSKTDAKVENNKLLNTYMDVSTYRENVYVGISWRMSTPEKERDGVIENIANQIAMKQRLSIDTVQVVLNKNGTLQNFYDSNLDYDDTKVDEIKKDITIIDSYVLPDIIVAIGRYTKDIASPLFIQEHSAKPAWINTMPKIDGYDVGVGMVGRYANMATGMVVADIYAAHKIAQKHKSYIDSFVGSKNSNAHGTSSSGSVNLSKAELTGFRIIDRWVEPDGSAYYSLAIANKIEN
jgi:hypothetical protein